MPYIHNVFLEYGLAAGIFGLMWAVALILVLVAGGLRAATSASRQVSLLGLAVVAISAFAGTQFLFDDNLLNPQYAWILAWLVGGSAVLLTSPRVDGGHAST
jgi:O-antigen ligase